VHHQYLKEVGFEVLTAVSTKMAVFWIVPPCRLVEVYQRFGGLCCLHHQGDETLVNFYQTTRRYNPEDSNLQSLKNHVYFLFLQFAYVCPSVHQ
jgi:hypothetical protein